jgi:tetratricopeptide (TPR) repeat protein
MKPILLLSLPILAAALSGCGVIARKAVDSITTQSLTSAKADFAYISTLTPTANSGPGVVVFDPVIDPSAKNSSALGTGIGRYLHFYVAGQGDFGKTTTLGHMDEVRRQYKLANWQVPLPTDAKKWENVRKYTASLGATHGVTGKLEQKNGVLQLRYDIFQGADDKLLKSFNITGSADQISAQLPSIARKMAVFIGAKSPAIPAKMALSSEDLKVIGAIPYLQKRKGDILLPEQSASLRKLATKDALSTALTLRTYSYLTEQQGISFSKNAIKLAPNNSLALSEPTSTQFSSLVTKTISSEIDSFKKKFPKNALGHHASFWRANNDWVMPDLVASGEMAVKCAPENAYFWRYLSVAFMNEAASVRDARYAKDISGAEWAKLDVSYSKALAASQHSTKIDPNYSFAWSRLCNDAMFIGDDDTAYAALERALEIDPTNHFAWQTGSQLTQPKWGGSISEFIDFEKRSAAYAKHFNVRDMQSVLKDSEHRNTLRDIYELVIKEDPENVGAISELGQHYHYFETNYPRAEALYRQALAINPNDGRTNSALGDLTYWTKSDPKTAEQLYRKALAAEPKNGYFYGNLGRMYALTGRNAEGVAMAQKAKQFGCDKSHPVWAATGVTPP